MGLGEGGWLETEGLCWGHPLSKIKDFGVHAKQVSMV